MNSEVFNPYKMFTGSMIPNVIMRYPGLSQSAKLMWGRLAQYAGEDGRCFPKMKTIAAEVCLSEHRVKMVIRELRENGFIKAVQSKGMARAMRQGNSYYFLKHPILADEIEGVCSGTVKGCTAVPTNDGVPPHHLEENQFKENHKEECQGQKNVPDQPVKKTKKKRKYWGTGDDREMATAVYQAIYQVNPTVKKPNIDKWANTIRLMREQDGRTHKEIEAAYRWAVRDSFWSEVILSASALRRNYHKFASKVGIVQSKTFGSAFDNRPNAGKKCKDCALYEIYGHIKTICADPERHACDDLFRPKEESAAPVGVS